MPFDIVRGKITKPEQSNQLIAAVKEYMEKNTTDGTLYLGYPLTANADEAITVEALWVTEQRNGCIYSWKFTGFYRAVKRATGFFIL